jgi:hypothetical protein
MPDPRVQPPVKPTATPTLASIFADPDRLRQRFILSLVLGPPRSRRRR